MAENKDLLLDAVIALHLLLGAFPESKYDPRSIYFEIDGRFYCRFCSYGETQHAEACPIGRAHDVIARYKVQNQEVKAS